MADLSITAANVLASTGATFGNLPAAVTITAGQAVYITAANTLGLADSDGVPPANTFAGIALNGGAAGQPIKYQTNGLIIFGGIGVVASGAIYLSDTPGGITQTIADLETGDMVISLGVLTSTTILRLNPTIGGLI